MIDANKTGGLRECIICQNWYFHRINFRFQTKICNICHDITQKYLRLNDAAIVTVGRSDYRVHFWSMTESEAVKRMKNADLSR